MNVPLSPGILLSASTSQSPKATQMIKLLINQGADVRVTSLNGNTLLHLSITIDSEAECLRRLKILVAAGCDLHACNLRGRTPFHFAAAQRYILVMEYLLSLGILVPLDVMLTQFEWIVTPTPPRYYSAIRFLLNKGGDVHTISENGDALLHFAAKLEPEHDALEVSKLLVGSGCNACVLNSEHRTPLHTAAQMGYITLVDYYLSLRTSLPPDILFAVSTGSSEKAPVIRYMIDKGANISTARKDGDTPLHLLLTEGEEMDRLDGAKILIDAGSGPRARNVGGMTPLHVAAKRGFTTILRYLVSQGVPLPDDILLASAPPTIHFLRGKGIDVRCVAANAHTQLMHRALDSPNEEDYLECAKILVDAGWDPSLKNLAGETPIHIVARNGHIPTIKYLLSQSTPLPPDILLAVMPNYQLWYKECALPLIHFLIHEGASVNATAPNGDTPLHLVLRHDHILLERSPIHAPLWRLAETLLNLGSDPTARNVDGQTPFDIAEANGLSFKENFLRLVRNSHHVRSSS